MSTFWPSSSICLFTFCSSCTMPWHLRLQVLFHRGAGLSTVPPHLQLHTGGVPRSAEHIASNRPLRHVLHVGHFIAWVQRPRPLRQDWGTVVVAHAWERSAPLLGPAPSCSRPPPPLLEAQASRLNAIPKNATALIDFCLSPVLQLHLSTRSWQEVHNRQPDFKRNKNRKNSMME